MAYSFGPFEVQPIERRLLVAGQPAAIGARAFDVLRVLVENHGRLVTKNELLDLVWPGLIVEEANLHVQISALRKLLGPQPIATIPGQGYRFAAAIDAVDGQAPTAVPPPASPLCAGGDGALGRIDVPAPLDELIGRDDELAALERLLAEHRLVSLIGPAGIGKTRLAIAAARARAGAHRHGACWVDLAALRSADQIAPAIANAAGVNLGEGDAAAQLARALSLRDELLLLDNCEHLLDGVAAIVESIVSATPRVHVLTTSQAALKLAGEQLLRLGPLAVPPAHMPLEAARCFGALRLLEQRAQAADRRFRLDERSINHAVDLCRDLDGIALAIEMAAARLPVLGFEALQSRLGDRLRLLRKDARGAPHRHQTLRAALDWSYALLLPQEQRVLDRLSLFAGSFRIDMAQQVAGDQEIDEWAVLDAMVGLVDKSLLQVVGNDPPRYRLLDSTRLYAAERLVATGQAEATRSRYVEAMARLAIEADESAWVTGDRAWIARYRDDHNDIELAFDLAYEQRRVGDAIILSTALWTFARLLARPASRRRWRLAACHSLLPHADALTAARILDIVSRCTLVLDNVTQVEAARLGVAAWRELGHHRNLYLALGWLSMHEARAGSFQAARQALDEGRRLEREEWGPRCLVTFLRASAGALGLLGEIAEHRRETEREHRLAQRGGLERAVVQCEIGLADVALAAGEAGPALELSRSAVDGLRRLDMTETLGIALANLCNAQLLCGQDDDASRAAAQAWPLLAQREYEGVLFIHLSLLTARKRQWEQSARLRGAADAWFHRTGNSVEPAEARLLALADALLAQAPGDAQMQRWRDVGLQSSQAQARDLAMQCLGFEHALGAA